MTGEQVVSLVGWAAKSKLSRLENGRSRPDLADVLDLLDLYHVGGRKRDQLVAIARDAGNTRAWQHAYPVMTPRQRGYAELEAGSDQIMEYGACIVPGLLQTEEYARLRIMSAPSRSLDSDVETEVAARMARQAVLTRKVDPPGYEVVIDEYALGERSGPDEVRKAQFARLRSASLLQNVTVRVLRRDAIVGPHYLPYTGFSIYHFVDPDDPETVTVETLARELVLSDQESVLRYIQLFDWLRKSAMDPDESKDWLNERMS
jgi:Domain of unknown function (DUF5753)/Helix-turn-helix domain